MPTLSDCYFVCRFTFWYIFIIISQRASNRTIPVAYNSPLYLCIGVALIMDDTVCDILNLSLQAYDKILPLQRKLSKLLIT